MDRRALVLLLEKCTLAGMLAMLPALAFPSPGETELVSLVEGAPRVTDEPSGPSGDSRLSADGRYLAFASDASNFVADDDNGVSDVFVHDRVAGTFSRVSVSSGGEQGDGASFSPVISADGRFVAFTSSASNLVGALTHPSSDVFIHDRETGDTSLVSAPATGPAADGISAVWSIGADGGFVAFTSLATNLVTDPPAPAPPQEFYEIVYVRDVERGVTVRVSESSSGEAAQGSSYTPEISGDGRYVAFVSYADNLVPGDDNGEPDIFVRDLETSTTTRVSVDSDGNQANGPSNGVIGISGDARFAAFDSDATNLVPDDPPGRDIFLHDRGTGNTTLITGPEISGDPRISGGGSLSRNGRYLVYSSLIRDPSSAETRHPLRVYDRVEDSTTEVPVAPGGEHADAEIYSPTVTEDGRIVAFTSPASNLIDEDRAGTQDVFVHDRDAARTTRLQAQPREVYSGNGMSDVAPGWALSRDGRYAVFSSEASDLVSGDTNDVSDVFVRDLVTGETERVSVRSDGTEGTGDEGSRLGAISADGRFVAFVSADELVDDGPGSLGVYLHDRATRTTTLIGDQFTSYDGFTAPRPPALSADGRFVAFAAVAFSLPFDPAPRVRVYDRETGETEVIRVDHEVGQDDPPIAEWAQTSPALSADGRYVALVSEPRTALHSEVHVYDRHLGTSRLVSGKDGVPLRFASAAEPAISANGRFVVFSSRAELVDEDTQNERDIYLRDLATGALRLISVDSGGSIGNGDSEAPSISEDGRYIAFESVATNLTSNDTNGVTDVFAHDRVSQTTVRVSTDAAGTEGNGESNRPSISGDATRALFSSEATNLTPATPDTNIVRDVFVHDLAPFPEVWPFQQGPEGLVSIEAEHFYVSLLGRSFNSPLPNTNRLDPWKPIPVADASGREAIQADPAWPQTLDVADAPLIGYGIQFEQAGPHHVWIRARSFSPQGDAYGIALNQGPEIRRFVEPDDGQWVWRRGWTAIDVAGPGEHRLWINRRERSVEIDKIVVTPDPDYTPADVGPDESPRAGANASPMLDQIGDRMMAVRETLTLQLRATDADGDVLSFSALGLPGFAALADHGDGTATLTFRPDGADAGTYAIRLIVTDDGVPSVSDEEAFELKVVGSAFRQGAGGLLVMEAEHFDASLPGHEVGPWFTIADAAASSGEAIRSVGRWAPSPIDMNPSRTEYDVEFTRTGPHYVWIRGRANAPQQDAFYVGLDDAQPRPHFVEPDSGEWVWNRGWHRIDVDEAGLHTLRIFRRERLVEIDKIVVTPGGGYQPDGEGPPESPRTAP